MLEDLYVVIAGGEEPKGLALQYIKKTAHIICADSGADFCYRNSIVPEMIIGDLDSLSEEAADFFSGRGVRFSVHPRKKNHTDTDFALAWCYAHSAKNVVLTGALGKRVDHSLANIMLLIKYPELLILNDISEIRLCRGNLKLRGEIGDLMTLIPLSPIVKNITLRGFEYPLEKESLLMRNNIGVSNVFTEKEAEVSVELGELLVICTAKEENYE